LTTGKVALQGTRGAFSHQALSALLPRAIAHFCDLPDQTFAALDAGEVDAVLLPLRNALAGPVRPHYELLRRNLLGDSPVACVAECDWPVHLQLIGLPGAQLLQAGTPTSYTEIEEVFSHPMALAQCHRFFAQHPEIRAVEFHDTAAAVEHIARAEDPRLAAIASAQAAEEFGATIVAPNIHDHPGNATRFALLVPQNDAETWRRRMLQNAPVSAIGAAFLPGLLGDQLHQAVTAAGLSLRSSVLLPNGEQLWGEDAFLAFELPLGESPEKSTEKWETVLERLTVVCLGTVDLGVFPKLPV
jgi:prephenate dehydratase